MRRTALIALLVLGGCSTTLPPRNLNQCPTGRPSLPAPTQPHDDPIEVLGRMESGTFIELLELRPHPNEADTFFYCSGVRGLGVVEAGGSGRPRLRQTLRSSLSHRDFPRCQHIAVEGDTLVFSSRGDEVQPTPFLAWFERREGRWREVATLRGTMAEAGGSFSFEGLALTGGRLFVAAHEAGLLEIERRDETLRVRARLNDFVNATGVALETRGEQLLAHVADGAGGLATADVTDPDAPRALGRAPLDGAAQQIELDPSRPVAWVAAGAGGVASVDLADPANPRRLAQLSSSGSAVQVALDGVHLAVANWNDVRVLDVTDASAPVVVAVERIETGNDDSRVLGVALRGGQILAGEWTGLYALRHHPERRAPRLVSASRTVELATTAAGGTDAAAVLLRNEGSERLNVSAIAVAGANGDAFTVEPTSLVLNPGESGAVEVTFKPDRDTQHCAQLELASNDPDTPVRVLPIVANRLGAGAGDPAPEVLVRRLDGSGEDWRLDAQRGSVVLLSYFATF